MFQDGKKYNCLFVKTWNKFLMEQFAIKLYVFIILIQNILQNFLAVIDCCANITFFSQKIIQKCSVNNDSLIDATNSLENGR